MWIQFTINISPAWSEKGKQIIILNTGARRKKKEKISGTPINFLKINLKGNSNNSF